MEKKTRDWLKEKKEKAKEKKEDRNSKIKKGTEEEMCGKLVYRNENTIMDEKNIKRKKILGMRLKVEKGEENIKKKKEEPDGEGEAL